MLKFIEPVEIFDQFLFFRIIKLYQIALGEFFRVVFLTWWTMASRKLNMGRMLHTAVHPEALEGLRTNGIDKNGSCREQRYSTLRCVLLLLCDLFLIGMD